MSGAQSGVLRVSRAPVDERLQANFSLSEFVRSDLAVRQGIDNRPTGIEMTHVRTVLAPGMQRVRNVLGVPVHITSGYRCPELNRALGGAPLSQHLQGLAADFVAPEFGSPRSIARFLRDNAELIRFDQLIFEGSWVHASFVDGRPRNQVLTAHFAGGGVTYSPGVA